MNYLFYSENHYGVPVLVPEIEGEIMHCHRTSQVSQGPTGEPWLETADRHMELP